MNADLCEPNGSRDGKLFISINQDANSMCKCVPVRWSYAYIHPSLKKMQETNVDALR